MKKMLAAILTVALAADSLYAAVGCSLSDPDRDIKRLFPQATNYKTDFLSIKEKGGEKLAERIEKKLADNLEPTYEAIDVPYAFYTVLKNEKTIGYVHGINQKGKYGGIQLILATDTNGIILDFYFQRLTSPESKKFRDKNFTGQFVGLSLANFYTEDMTKKIKDPTEKSREDFLATIRGLKKNLILFDEFKLDNKYDKFFNSNVNNDPNNPKVADINNPRKG
jgi:hypothetical protein